MDRERTVVVGPGSEPSSVLPLPIAFYVHRPSARGGSASRVSSEDRLRATCSGSGSPSARCAARWLARARSRPCTGRGSVRRQGGDGRDHSSAVPHRFASVARTVRSWNPCTDVNEPAPAGAPLARRSCVPENADASTELDPHPVSRHRSVEPPWHQRPRPQLPHPLPHRTSSTSRPRSKIIRHRETRSAPITPCSGNPVAPAGRSTTGRSTSEKIAPDARTCRLRSSRTE